MCGIYFRTIRYTWWGGSLVKGSHRSFEILSRPKHLQSAGLIEPPHSITSLYNHWCPIQRIQSSICARDTHPPSTVTTRDVYLIYHLNRTRVVDNKRYHPRRTFGLNPCAGSAYSTKLNCLFLIEKSNFARIYQRRYKYLTAFGNCVCSGILERIRAGRLSLWWKTVIF